MILYIILLIVTHEEQPNFQGQPEVLPRTQGTDQEHQHVFLQPLSSITNNTDLKEI